MAIICARLNSSVDIACRDIQARQESWQVEFEAKAGPRRQLMSKRVSKSVLSSLYNTAQL